MHDIQAQESQYQLGPSPTLNPRKALNSNSLNAHLVKATVELSDLLVMKDTLNLKFTVNLQVSTVVVMMEDTVVDTEGAKEYAYA